jgi:hypothetical protein
MKKDTRDNIDFISAIFAPTSLSKFGYGSIGKSSPSKPSNDIGQGISFIPTDDFKKIDHLDYGYLYKGDKKISDIPFRKGGLFHGFKDNKYCSIIAYPDLCTIGEKGTWGNHVIIDTDANIVLSSTSSLNYPYYHKGIIGSIDRTYYNLETKKPIVKSDGNTLSTDNYLFVQHSYNWSSNTIVNVLLVPEEHFEIGVYKIEYATSNYEIFK